MAVGVAVVGDAVVVVVGDDVVAVDSVLFARTVSAHKVIGTECGLSPHCMSIGCVCTLHQFYTAMAN